MSEGNGYFEEYEKEVVKDLLWSRNYYKMCLKEINMKLEKMNRKYKLDAVLEED